MSDEERDFDKDDKEDELELGKDVVAEDDDLIGDEEEIPAEIQNFEEEEE